MRKILFISCIFVVFTSFTSCQKNKDSQTSEQDGSSKLSIVEHEIVNEIVGDSSMVRVLEYTIVSVNDTSSFMPRFRFSTEDSLYYMSLQLSDSGSKINYKDIMQELYYVLSEVANNNNIASLKSIFVGRLLLLGDQTIDLSNAYLKQFGTANISTEQDDELRDFIMNSSLTADFNRLLLPYNLRLKRVNLTRISLVNKIEFENLYHFENESKEVPKLLLDAVCSYDIENIK